MKNNKKYFTSGSDHFDPISTIFVSVLVYLFNFFAEWTFIKNRGNNVSKFPEQISIDNYMFIKKNKFYYRI